MDALLIRLQPYPREGPVRILPLQRRLIDQIPWGNAMIPVSGSVAFAGGFLLDALDFAAKGGLVDLEFLGRCPD